MHAPGTGCHQQVVTGFTVHPDRFPFPRFHVLFPANDRFQDLVNAKAAVCQRSEDGPKVGADGGEGVHASTKSKEAPFAVLNWMTFTRMGGVNGA